MQFIIEPSLLLGFIMVNLFIVSKAVLLLFVLIRVSICLLRVYKFYFEGSFYLNFNLIFLICWLYWTNFFTFLIQSPVFFEFIELISHIIEQAFLLAILIIYYFFSVLGISIIMLNIQWSDIFSHFYSS